MQLFDSLMPSFLNSPQMRCQARIVSGFTIVSTDRIAFRPMASAASTNRRRSSSVNRIRPGTFDLTSPAVLRFHIPLIEPDVRVSRIRLSDKASCVRPREAARQHRQPEVTVGLVELFVGVACGAPTPLLVLAAQPPTQPCRHMGVHGSIGPTDGAEAEVVRPAAQQAVEVVSHVSGVPPEGVVPCQVADRAKHALHARLIAAHAGRNVPVKPTERDKG